MEGATMIAGAVWPGNGARKTEPRNITEPVSRFCKECPVKAGAFVKKTKDGIIIWFQCVFDWMFSQPA